MQDNSPSNRHTRTPAAGERGATPSRPDTTGSKDEGDPAVELKCVRCGARGLRDGGGAWECGGCGARFPVLAKVPGFVAEEFYSESFGFQWNHFARTQLDSATGTSRSRDDFILKTGWSLADLQGKQVLDAGCGMGRFAEVCAAAGARIHAVDLSTAVEVASRNLAHRPNVRTYQADIMNLPFPDESFDFIYSIGVLHHTPHTKSAFLTLPPLLKPGGVISIWVYSTKLQSLVGGKLLRKVSSRLPKRWLLGLCRIADPLYHVYHACYAVHPKMAAALQTCLPVSLDPDPQWRLLDTFDWYAPRYQWKHTYEEVESWFREAGLTEIWRGQFPVSVRGIRPSPAPQGAVSAGHAKRPGRTVTR